MNSLWPYHCFLLRQVRSAKGSNSCQMARCASLWPRRGSSLLNFAHVFRILSDLLGVLVRILLWVEALGSRPVQRPCTCNWRIFLKVLRAVGQPSWNRSGLGCGRVGVGSYLINGLSQNLKESLPGSPTMHGKGDVIEVAGIPVLFGVTAGGLMIPSLTVRQSQCDWLIPWGR